MTFMITIVIIKGKNDTKKGNKNGNIWLWGTLTAGFQVTAWVSAIWRLSARVHSEYIFSNSLFEFSIYAWLVKSML